VVFDEAKARAYVFEPITVTVDRGRLAFFARAQSFTYHALAHAGDTLTLRSRITGVKVRSGGAMVLLVKTTDITRDGELVAEASSTIIVLDREAGS
jgi:acyl-CoA thioesterase FadM